MAAATNVCLFGQSGALFLLEQCGGTATAQQVIDYLGKNYPGAMTPEMVRKGLRKLCCNGFVDYVKPAKKQGYAFRTEYVSGYYALKKPVEVGFDSLFLAVIERLREDSLYKIGYTPALKSARFSNPPVT